jgi:plasmid maintenance system antidote protein VapI
MPSLQITISPDKRAAARFIGKVRRAIQKAYIEEQRKRGISQSDIARALGVHRSVINRELRGFKDLTLGRVAELAWALGRQPTFTLEERVSAAGQNSIVIAPPPISTDNAQSVQLVQPSSNDRFVNLKTEARAAA